MCLGIARLIEDCVYGQEHDSACLKLGIRGGKTAGEIAEMARISGIIEAIEAQVEEENEELKAFKEEKTAEVQSERILLVRPRPAGRDTSGRSGC
jgi:hypothetical protein